VAQDGAGWHFDAPPDASDFVCDVAVAPALTTVLGDQVFAPGHAEGLTVHATAVRNLPLVVLREARIHQTNVDGTLVTFVTPVARRTVRNAPGPGPEDLLETAVRSALEQRPATLRSPTALTVVAAPLRWNLTSPSDGLVVVSDRTLHVFPLLRGFHEAQVAK